jgi:hypothetical protein
LALLVDDAEREGRNNESDFPALGAEAAEIEGTFRDISYSNYFCFIVFIHLINYISSFFFSIYCNSRFFEEIFTSIHAFGISEISFASVLHCFS